MRLKFIGDCSVEIDGATLTPAAAHLFALVLLFALEPERRRSREELRDYLFPPSEDQRLAAHNLRQLLYRLRRMGVQFDERPSGLRLREFKDVDYAASLRALSLEALATLSADDLAFLPAYAPRLPAPFSDWLAEVRDRCNYRIREELFRLLSQLRNAHSWHAVLHLTTLIATLDPLNVEGTLAHAEALAMLGRRDEALRELATFELDALADAPALSKVRRYKQRITRLPSFQRKASLVGRDSDLAALVQEWSRLGSDGARLSILIGSAGIGKTRVAEAFAEHVILLGGRVIKYDCDENSRSQPLSLFWHILPALRSMRGSIGASPDYYDALSRVRPSAGSAELVHEAGVALEALRVEIQAALVDLCEAVTGDQQLLLMIDDAHLLDAASLAVLRSLVGRSNSAHLLIVACMRPTHVTSVLSASTRKCIVTHLQPLADPDSHRLLLELLSPKERRPEHIAWCIAQAAGNPLFLHTLALQTTADAHSLPFDLRSVASSSYYSLSSHSRSVLEACLLLGRLATLSRVTLVALCGESSLSDALRELEERDLVHFKEGLLVGPHVLFHEALLELIPTSVAGLLHGRVATLLEAECLTDRFDSSAALAAARSWLASGNAAAATLLLRRCASHAATLGESLAATQLLEEVLDAAVPPQLKAALLDDLVSYAQSSGSQGVAVTALRDRYVLAHQLAETSAALRAIELRTIEAGLLNGEQLAHAVPPLLTLAESTSADAGTRMQAIARLLVIADQELNRDLARHSYSLIDKLGWGDEGHARRAALVFNTSFGDLDEARRLADGFHREFVEPSVHEMSIQARNFAAYAYHRLRASDIAILLCEDNYTFLLAHGVYNQALYAASLRTEIALAAGDLGAASLWLRNAKAAARGIAPHELAPNAGLYGNEGILAMLEGRYDEAEGFIFAPGRENSILSAPRHKAVAIATSVRLRQLRMTQNVTVEEIDELEHLYGLGRDLGGQDSIVESLWCARVLARDPNGASRLLEEYLTVHRRERSIPDWSLRQTTATDGAWRSYTIITASDRSL